MIQNKRFVRSVLLFLALSMLLMPGCSEEQGVATEPVAQATEVIKPTETLPMTGQEEDPTVSLNALRQAMVETPQLFAVASFGLQERVDPDSPTDALKALQARSPKLCEDLPFLLDIPTERIIGGNGELFCIVPLDADATVAVSKGYWDAENQQYIYDDILYSSNSGEPILLFCNDAGWEPDTQVYISGPSGEVFWYPQIDDNHCAMPLRNDNGESLFYDFSSYREVLADKYSSLMEYGEWKAVLPAKEMLVGKTWEWSGFLKDGREVFYRVIFQEDTLSVRWNDGIDKTDHEYLYAPWELTGEGGFAVLTVDFGEFAGILRYNLLYSETFDELYVGMDLLQEELPIGWEPLYRILMQSVIPEPVEMIGTWERAWSEVEYDWNEAEPGACIVEIRSAASGGLLMSYTSRDFPNDNFQNELLTIHMRPMHILCGNDAWVADLDYIGPYDTTYTLTLTADGTLIKQNYYLLDGAPTVSFEYFHRVEE